MNRSHTVFLDQLSRNGDASLLVGSVALPSFTLEMAGITEPPKTNLELLQRLTKWIWGCRNKIVIVYILFHIIRRLHRWSRGRQSIPSSLLGSTPPAAFLTSVSTGGWLYTRAWRVTPDKEKGRVFILHAFREHIGRYEPVANELNRAGFSVFGLDHQGHGRSQGTRGYVESFQHLIADYMEFMEDVMRNESRGTGPNGRCPPVYLFGHTLGATMAMQIARIHAWRAAAEEEDRDVAGAGAAVTAKPATISEEELIEEEDARPNTLAPSTSHPSAPSSFSSSSSSTMTPAFDLSGLILSCPALIPDPRSGSPLMQALASSLADVLPRFAIGSAGVIDSSAYTTLAQSARQYQRDPLIYRGGMTARFGHEMLEAMADARFGAAELTLPIFIAQSRGDRIISPDGAKYLYRHVDSTDKTLRMYDSPHDLYLDTARHELMRDVLSWLDRQTAQIRATHAYATTSTTGDERTNSEVNNNVRTTLHIPQTTSTTKPITNATNKGKARGNKKKY